MMIFMGQNYGQNFKLDKSDVPVVGITGATFGLFGYTYGKLLRSKGLMGDKMTFALIAMQSVDILLYINKFF